MNWLDEWEREAIEVLATDPHIRVSYLAEHALALVKVARAAREVEYWEHREEGHAYIKAETVANGRRDAMRQLTAALASARGATPKADAPPAPPAPPAEPSAEEVEECARWLWGMNGWGERHSREGSWAGEDVETRDGYRFVPRAVLKRYGGAQAGGREGGQHGG